MKNLKTLSRRFALLLAVCFLLVPLCASGVSAVNLSESCSIMFHFDTNAFSDMFGENGNTAVVADLYLVADAVAVENADAYTFQLRELYSHYGLPNPGDAGVDRDAFAQEAMKIALEYDATPTVSAVPANTKAENLSAGLYLVLIHGNDVDYVDTVNGKQVTTALSADGRTRYCFNPVLVSVPTKPADSEGSVNTANPGAWIYDHEFTPKPEQDDYSEKRLILHKVGEDGKKLPNAKFKLYATRLVGDINGGDINDGIPVDNEILTVYTEEYGYITLYCVGEYTTDKNGDIIISHPDVMDDDVLYAWVETEAPEGYDLDPTPHFFFAYQAEEAYPSERYPDTVYFDAANAGGSVWVTREMKHLGSSMANVLTFRNVSEEPIDLKVQGYDCEGVSFSLFDVPDLLKSFECETLDELNDSYDLNVEADYDWSIDWDEGCGELKSLPAGASATLFMRIDLSADYKDVYEDHGLLRPTFTYKCFKAGESLGTADARAYRVVTYQYAQNDAEVGIHAVNKKSVVEPDGTELPETGGMGTTAFFLAGSGLAAIALFLLIIKKRGEA